MDFCARILLSCFIEVYTPPEEYNYEPTIPYTIEYLSSADLQRKCWVSMGWTWGCVAPTYKPKILLDITLKGTEAGEVIIDHEKAHINGWRH